MIEFDRGAEPKQLAFSAALGTTLGLFPIVGTFVPPFSSTVAVTNSAHRQLLFTPFPDSYGFELKFIVFEVLFLSERLRICIISFSVNGPSVAGSVIGVI